LYPLGVRFEYLRETLLLSGVVGNEFSQEFGLELRERESGLEQPPYAAFLLFGGFRLLIWFSNDGRHWFIPPSNSLFTLSLGCSFGGSLGLFIGLNSLFTLSFDRPTLGRTALFTGINCLRSRVTVGWLTCSAPAMRSMVQPSP
jgi:hypothetical protein